MPLISIITPVYNVEAYLRRCIDSILGQTFVDFELILVNDGSTDRSGGICEEYAALDGRITVLHQENQGQAAARNKAMDMARGTYYAFIDSDDWVHPQYLEILLTNLRRSNSKVSICSHARVTNPTGFSPLTPETPRTWEGKEYVRQCMTGKIPNKAWLLWDKLFHRDCFANIRLPLGRIYEDNAVVYKILYEAEQICECDDILYCYFQNESGTVNQPLRKKHLDWLLVPREMIQYFTAQSDDIMIDKANRMLLYSLEDLLRKTRKQLDDPKTEANLRQQLMEQYKQERKRYPITMRTHPGLFEQLYPLRARIYWTARGVYRKIAKR